MKWIGQHIYDLVSRFREDVYFENDIYFEGGVNFNTDTVTFTSANADDPAVIIENTTADAQAARLLFKKHRGVDAVDGDNIGEIEFWGYDDGTPSTQMYAKMYAEIHDATSGEESGLFGIQVANHDGGFQTGLSLTGGSQDNEIDATIGHGAASVTTVGGTLTMGSTATINNSGVIQVAAQTVIDHDQLANFAAQEHYTQANITTVGTIGTGVWQGTAIGASYVATLNQDTTGEAGTVATIAGLAPNTATTQATQPAIESIGTDGDTLTILSDQLLMSNTTNSAPTIKLVNTTDDDEGSQLIFEKLRDDDAVASGQNLGEIWFKGQDASQNTEDYAYIIGEIDVATHGQESGQLKLGLANHDGGNGNGLILTGGSENDEIDVTVGLGANSVVSVPGNIDLAGDIDVDGTLETDALTIGGAAVLAQATASAVGAVELATTAEADSGTDTTRAITAAGLKSHVDARYQYTYTSFIGISDIATNWAIPHANGWNAYANQWSIDTSVSATSIDTTISVTRAYTAVGFTVPHDGILVGFYATIRNNDNDNQPAVGLFHQSGATIWGLVSATNFALKAYAAASYAGGAGTNYKGPCKAIDLSRSLALTAGDVIIPAVLEASTDKVFCNITMVIKTLVP